MGRQQAKPPAAINTRRTGIDRRWIPSADHHPERRSGKDRRSVNDRPFLAPIESNDQDGRTIPSLDIAFSTDAPETVDGDRPASEKYVLKKPGSIGEPDVNGENSNTA